MIELLRNPFKGWFLIALIAINILGSIYGYYWYGGQLSATPLKLWIFTFDSPFSTTLFAAALLGIYFSREIQFLQLIAYTSVIKYGIWASVVILHFWFTSGGPTFITTILLISHLGMALEGLVFIRHLYVYSLYVVIIGGWFLLNDYMDYVVGVHPYLYHLGQFGIAGITAVVLSLLLVIYLWKFRLFSKRFIFKN